MTSFLAVTARLATAVRADVPPSGPFGEGDDAGWFVPAVVGFVVLALVVVAVVVIRRRR